MNVRSLIPLILSLLILIGAGALYGFAYYRLDADRTSAQNLQTQINQKSAALARVSEARTALETLASDEESLRQYTLRKENIVPFLEQIQGVGKPLGASVQVLSVGDEKSVGHARVGLSLSITGTFDAVLRTLGAIEYGPYDGVITNLTFDTVPGSSTWSAAVLYSVGVSTSTPSKP